MGVQGQSMAKVRALDLAELRLCQRLQGAGVWCLGPTEQAGMHSEPGGSGHLVWERGGEGRGWALAPPSCSPG